MPYDASSIIAQLRPVKIDLGDEYERARNRETLLPLFRARKDDEIQREAFRNNLEADDGGPAKIDRAGLLREMTSRGMGAKAVDIDRQIERADTEELKNRWAKIDRWRKIVASAVDEDSWQAVRQMGREEGHDISQVPDHFDEGYVASRVATLTTPQQKIERELRRRGLDLREQQLASRGRRASAGSGRRGTSDVGGYPVDEDGNVMRPWSKAGKGQFLYMTPGGLRQIPVREESVPAAEMTPYQRAQIDARNRAEDEKAAARSQRNDLEMAKADAQFAASEKAMEDALADISAAEQTDLEAISGVLNKSTPTFRESSARAEAALGRVSAVGMLNALTELKSRGGTLGALSESEGRLLQAAAADLERAQGAKELRAALDRFRRRIEASGQLLRKAHEAELAIRSRRGDAERVAPATAPGVAGDASVLKRIISTARGKTYSRAKIEQIAPQIGMTADELEAQIQQAGGFTR